MKRILSLTLALATIISLLSLAGCSGKKDRILYSTVNLKKYVSLGDYKDLKVNTKSDEFKKEYDSVVANDIENNNLYVTKKEGTVEKGDNANIDYEGKLNGVAFDGGTAKGTDLEIGSGKFIPGFEDALIGKEIGSTSDINLTFPEDYGNEELNGKAVVFTVKINFVTTTTPLEPEEYFENLGYKTLAEYKKATKETAIKNFLMDKFLDSCKTKKYPEDDIKILKKEYMNMLETTVSTQYGMTLDNYLSAIGQSKDDFEESILEEQIKPAMDSQMPMYLILDREKVSVTAKDVENKINEIAKESGGSVSAKDLKDYYGDYYFENVLVTEKALDILYKNAKIS